ncbi:hypothetical protein DYB32_005911 [Aphanomyces invadans]|uniref:6-phosphofructo-2-kinase domain-containing protein n=1 Tax=Aphanomyces invadans TaxID=157072 RepID=A0A3R6WK79_9STRA|nr:hypothetical protein DYB32_005911 [Aphanomyces invadans]
MLKYLNNEGEVAIYDGTNSTLERRLWIQERVSKSDGYHLLFIESICEDERIIERNIIDTKLRSPDYKATSPEEAVADFRARIAMYRKNYEALGEADEIFSYRYPLGESYMDVLSRLEPVIFELERCRTPVVIVAHVEVVRCLYAYFLDLPILDIPKVHAPFNEVIELHTTAYECLETRHVLLAPE